MNDFADLETIEDLDQSKGHDNREKFPCIKCSGTGHVSGGFKNPWSGKCFACNGKGYFLTSPQQRAKARSNAHKRKNEKICKYIDENQELVSYLTDVSSWNDFANSLLQSIHKYGKLTDGQHAAALRAKAKHEARQIERKAEQAKREADAPVLDLTRINEMFAKAGEHLKKPALRVGNVRISLAPANGKNAGYLYAKVDGEYAGKISPEGKLLAVRSAPADLEQVLTGIANDPLGKLVEHGRLTGNCACCGRELTKHDSIERGIGPICASRWGL